MTQLRIAPRSPWQNGFAERWVGTARREIVDHVIVLSEPHLRRILREYVAYYNADRPHMALGGDVPMRRDVEPPSMGRVVAMPKLGGLHHRYSRGAARTPFPPPQVHAPVAVGARSGHRPAQPAQVRGNGRGNDPDSTLTPA
ncbi:MAG: integrase core domain-containing protein [Polyangiaceae bacterium]